jgi:phosphinothricin acetyltransferase
MTTIRLASPADAAQILAIYSPYIENTSFTFETITPTIDQFAERISSYLQTWPWLVCEIDGLITGYAYASRYRERTAYQWCTEVSVYVHDDFQQRNIARALYLSLFDILERQGFRNIYAVVNLPNERSVAFHESLGFTWFATYEQVGYKLGKWKNVGWWRKTLNDFGMDPAAPIAFKQMDKNFLQQLFEKQKAIIKTG